MCGVSIVSIQTDQSRPEQKDIKYLTDNEFQSYQSKQINPDFGFLNAQLDCGKDKFQSYQSKQINPDQVYTEWGWYDLPRFNRINPNRSIPTSENSYSDTNNTSRVSIVSIQTDQSRPVLVRIPDGLSELSFNRINPNRSIPTRDLGCFATRLIAKFQSYQSKQINPDLQHG